MSIAFASTFPEALIRKLYDADEASSDRPALPKDSREPALAWLRRALVDFDALDQHIGLLQRLYASPFQYPRPRRDGWDPGQAIERPADSTFTHSEPLDDERITAILDQGIDCLADYELFQLLLNPYALFDLFDCIDDVQPDYWLDAIHDFVTAHGTRQSTAQIPESNGHSSAPLVTTRPTPLADGEEFWDHLAITLAAALKEVPRTTSPPVLSPANHEASNAPAYTNSASTHWLAAASIFGCAASLAAIWFALQASSTERAMQMQIAMLEQRQALSGNSHAGPEPGIILHSRQSKAPSLTDLAKTGFLNLQVAEHDPQSSLSDLQDSASPELRALIHELLARKMEPLDIMKYLRSLLSKENEE